MPNDYDPETIRRRLQKRDAENFVVGFFIVMFLAYMLGQFLR